VADTVTAVDPVIVPALKDLLAKRIAAGRTSEPEDLADIIKWINEIMVLFAETTKIIDALHDAIEDESDVSSTELAALKLRVDAVETSITTINAAIKAIQDTLVSYVAKTDLTKALTPITTAIADIREQFTDYAKAGIYVEHRNSPETVGTSYPDWRVWLQVTIKDGRHYAALYLRSLVRDGAVLIRELVGEIAEVEQQDGTHSYSGILGVNFRYTKVRGTGAENPDAYTVWVTATESLTSASYLAFDASGAQVDGGVLANTDGVPNEISPLFETRKIRLVFDWVDPDRANDTHEFEVI
jgi:hypothetical protein